MSRASIPFLLAASGVALALAPAAWAGDKLLQVLPAAELAKAPAHRYASLGRDEAVGALRERGAVFDEVPAEKAPGVLAPVRLTARLGGVHFHGMLKGEAAVSTPFEIADARLALALNDFAGILARHGVTEVTHFSMYRPGGLKKLERPGTTPIAARGGGETAAAPTTSRHPAGLAIDVATLHKADGTVLSVAKNFSGRIGARTCGDDVPVPEDAAAKELHAIVCEAASSRIFTYILTPNFNAAHRDHFHMEVKPDVTWMLIH